MKIYPCIRYVFENESHGAHVTEIVNQMGRFATFQQHRAQSTQDFSQSPRHLKDICIYYITDERRKITSEISLFRQQGFGKNKSVFDSFCVDSCQSALRSEASQQN